MSQADPSHSEGHASPFLRLILCFLPILSRSPLHHHYSITTTCSSLSVPLIYALFSSFLFLFLMIVKILSGNWAKFSAGAGPREEHGRQMSLCACAWNHQKVRCYWFLATSLPTLRRKLKTLLFEASFYWLQWLHLRAYANSMTL